MDSVGLALVAVVLGLILLGQVWVWLVLYQVIQQRGRLLLRLDEIERQLARVGLAGTNGHLAQAGQLPILAQTARPAQPAGLAVGSAFAPFRLPDLAGHEVGLEDLRGKRVMLLHWSPQCGFCDLIAPDLANLQPELQKANVQLVLVSHGEADRNRRLAEEHGLTCPILLQSQAHLLQAFQTLGTPAAYLLDERGRVAKPLAIGAEQVAGLARDAVAGSGWNKRLPGQHPLSESRIEREGLKAGTPAPTFSLPDVHGNTVSLEAYRGRKVLLVFTDPHCGPCDQLAPELVRLHR
ncbi:MAG: redoxin domain-containing protein, partial [Chloroflexi bacterium]|nr:redoxin domain-containing protein [Chloroflexota bacterium]